VRITYVLPYPELGGGTKVTFQHAGLLQQGGADVTVLGEGRRPDWVAGSVPYLDLSAGEPNLPSQDLVVATFYTTVEPARRRGFGPLAHFCQGYEGGLVHLLPVLPEIERIYRQPLPTLTVTPYLAAFLRQRFGRDSAVVSPPLDPLFRPGWRWGPRRRPWIAVPGIFEAEVKGVETALRAVARLRTAGLGCRLLRLSTLPLTDAERRLAAPDLYLCSVPPEAAAGALRRCDLLLFPSRAEEGFGLPLLEALASKVPAVATRIPSAEYIGGAAAWVDPGDDAAMAAAASEILGDSRRWRGARRRGREAALRFRPAAVAHDLEAAVRWAREAAASA
jgi:glycosyltransferase involved in cell wall biosynthesis